MKPAKVRRRLEDALTTGRMIRTWRDAYDSHFTDGLVMIGRLLKAGRKRVRLRFIRCDGTWVDEIDRWKYDQISSIHIGGRYIDALATFGDPCPDDTTPTPAAST